MLKVYTMIIVAFVANIFAANITFMDEIGNAMSTESLSSNFYIPVSFFAFSSSPIPASSNGINGKLGKKSFDLSLIDLEKFGRLIYGFGRFIHIHIMFGFRAVSGAEYTGDGSFIFGQNAGFVK